MQQPLYGSQPRTQATTATWHPKSFATALLATGRETLRPMPPKVEGKDPGWMPQTEQPGEAATHVVGSQGRRGILPSAPGRPAAPAADTDAGKDTTTPVKDADGKFPCPHCSQTYIHAKHLKRHLLRHTGDRPYMCVLCRDTFSRIDILKRHFQKCSIRRGNPEGLTHRSKQPTRRDQPSSQREPVERHMQNKSAPVVAEAPSEPPIGHSLGRAWGNQKPAGAEGDMNHVNGMDNMPSSDGMDRPGDMGPVSDGMNNMFNYQNQLTRSSSMGDGDTPDRRSMPGPGIGSSQPYPSDVSNSMTSQQMPYSMPYGQNGLLMYGGPNANQQSSLDWSQIFQASAPQM